MNYVSWYDALRSANWMHNGQPTGAQDVSTTEDGAYDMSLGSGVVRKPGALVVLPSEDEWYKAAYYKGGGTNAGYWDYPTQSNTVPAADAPPGTNMTDGSANYYSGGYINTTYYTTVVGAYQAKPSDSAYGTFDQGGNLWEWNDTLMARLPGCVAGRSPTPASASPCTRPIATAPARRPSAATTGSVSSPFLSRLRWHCWVLEAWWF